VGGLQGGASTAMSQAKDAKSFDPDLQPWERQPDEPDEAYQMFLAFRDMPNRNMATFDQPQYLAREWSARKARHWSSRWSWGWRNANFDRYMANVDVENMVRYRRMMHERHRKVAAAGFAKIAQWVKNLDVTKLTATEAIRLFEVFVRIESMAAGTHTVDDETPTQQEQEVYKPTVTIRDLIPDIDPRMETELAYLLDWLCNPDDPLPSANFDWLRNPVNSGNGHGNGQA
jgi:hypothetical protein